MRARRRFVAGVCLSAATLLPGDAALGQAYGSVLAPSDSAAATPCIAPHERSNLRLWIGGAAIVAASAALDRPLRDAAARNATRDLDQVADALDPFGRARYLLPALAGAWLLPRLTGHEATADAALRVGLGYLAADAVESVLKPAVGRHRPQDGGGAWRFRPLRNTSDEWHSFPSAHTVHAFSIASAVAMQTDHTEVAVGAYTLAALVGTQRVYTRAHWTSDVVVSTALGIGVSTATVRWIRRHGVPGVLRPVER